MMSPRKLGVLASHPIQYQAPLFRELARVVDLRVYFACRQTPQGQANAGFAVAFDWDIDLLSGYPHEFLENVSRHPDPSRFFGCDTPAIAAAIRTGAFDAFMVTGWHLKAYWQAIWACRAARVPVMVRGDSQLGTARGPIKRWVKKATYPALLRQFDACLYVGERNREYLAYYGVPPERAQFSPHCVDNDRFADAAAARDRKALRRRFGILDHESIVLFVGKFIDIKRPWDVISAIALLRERGLPARGFFVGDGPLKEQLTERCRNLQIPVDFAGFWNQTALPDAYAIADVLVLPSQSETWGLVVNEALASGLRAVVSDTVGCAPDLVLPSVTGEVFATGDTKGLADAVQRVVARPCDREAIHKVIDRYSPAAAAGGILAAMAARSANRVTHG